MNKQTITIIVLSIILIGIGGVYAYNEVTEKAYVQGVQDSILLMNQQILQNLQQNGYVPFVFNNGNQTQTINLVPYQNE